MKNGPEKFFRTFYGYFEKKILEVQKNFFGKNQKFGKNVTYFIPGSILSIVSNFYAATTKIACRTALNVNDDIDDDVKMTSNIDLVYGVL